MYTSNDVRKNVTSLFNFYLGSCSNIFSWKMENKSYDFFSDHGFEKMDLESNVFGRVCQSVHKRVPAPVHLEIEIPRSNGRSMVFMGGSDQVVHGSWKGFRSMVWGGGQVRLFMVQGGIGTWGPRSMLPHDVNARLSCSELYVYDIHDRDGSASVYYLLFKLTLFCALSSFLQVLALLPSTRLDTHYLRQWVCIKQIISQKYGDNISYTSHTRGIESVWFFHPAGCMKELYPETAEMDPV